MLIIHSSRCVCYVTILTIFFFMAMRSLTITKGSFFSTFLWKQRHKLWLTSLFYHYINLEYWKDMALLTMSPISPSISPWVALVFAAGVNWFSRAGKLFGLTVRRKTFLKVVKPAGQKSSSQALKLPSARPLTKPLYYTQRVTFCPLLNGQVLSLFNLLVVKYSYYSFQ